MDECVVLVHGLWLNSLAMYPLHARLARSGFQVQRFGYASVRSTPERNIDRLRRAIQAVRAKRIHLVGHSLGGVLIMHALAKDPDPRIARAVLLGAPVAGSHAGRSLARSRGGRWMLGESLPLWSAGKAPEAPAGIEVGVLAGDLPIGLGRIVAHLPKGNDGVVALAETRVVGAADSLVLRVNHTGMIFSGALAQQVCTFLKEGRFAHA